MAGTITKTEILSLVVRLTFVSTATYLSIRWLLNQIDPTKKNKNSAKKRAQEQLKRIAGTTNTPLPLDNLTDYEMMIAAHLVHPEDISVTWQDVGGLEAVIQELRETVIFPVQRRDLFADSELTQPPKGVLLHGPPGCGKTMIAKATAREAGMRFINLDVSILTDKWYGESQKLAAAVFTLAVKLEPCIVFIDEIDSFLRMRNSTDHEATAMMKAQFMSFWDGLITNSKCTVIIMGATNRPQDLDRAILRRMPATFNIPMPNEQQRAKILELVLRNEPQSDDVDLERIVTCTEGFSGSDLRELCRNAALYRVKDFLNVSTSVGDSVGDQQAGGASSSSALRSIAMADLMKSFNKMKQSKIQCGTLPIRNRLDLD